MTVIIGLNIFHADSAACLLLDGKLVGAVAEERLGDRKKHTSKFPTNAIRWLLNDNGLSLKDVDYIAIPRNGKANVKAKALWASLNPSKGIPATLEHFRRARNTGNTVDQLAEMLGEDAAAARYQIVNVEHHLAHIASSYYVSPFDSLTAGFSYDGSGDFASAMLAACEGTSIDVKSKAYLPHSLGFFYTALCQFIGFDRFGEEYKVMGLAPYGEDVYGDEMKKLVKLSSDGFYKLSSDYFSMHQGGESGSLDENGFPVISRMYTDKLKKLLGDPAKRDEVTQREKNIARSVQVRFEEAAIHCLTQAHNKIPTTQLVMAGGCALNGVANARILRETPFETPYLQAASSDDGTCIGAAYHCWHHVLGQKERFHMTHAFWGPRYTDERIRTAIEAVGHNISVQECVDLDETVEVTADLIASGLVLGWYQGRSEWGPRALGNRSILANPALPGMKDAINAKIKRRESFRPFAPSVLQEDVPFYFEQNVYSPFMMHVVKLKPEWRDKLPSITHVDGTGRIQSVSKEFNALYYKLIHAFKQRTGIGIVLNTSFNENEPVVDTPEQALDCFLRTEMDALTLGRFVLRKQSTY